ncbi:MAG: hypothetical protein IJ689_04215 [Alphaproteobacteria bacterium]|nr:hypothetical protein [Alphaproteobacteria bacterium]
MTNKTFLILLLLGVSYTAYNAAAVSENFEISTTIDHEITLGNFRTASDDADVTKNADINLGTLVINPAYEGYTSWRYSDSGVRYDTQGAIISAPNAAVGTFSANIPNPEDCNAPNYNCGGLRIRGNYGNSFIINLFGGSDGGNICGFWFKYSGNSNSFTVYPDHCAIGKVASVTSGKHTGTLSIEYTPR